MPSQRNVANRSLSSLQWRCRRAAVYGPADKPPADGGGPNAERDFHAEKRTNATHASTTDPDARLIRRRRSKEAKLCHMGHLLMENRSGLIVDALVSEASGTAEREAALTVLGRLAARHRATLGADKRYDAAAFVGPAAASTSRRMSPRTPRASAIDGRTTRHPGYAVSQRIRKRVEEAFGWIKTIGGLRKTRHRGTARAGWMFTLTAAAANLIRLPKLIGGLIMSTIHKQQTVLWPPPPTAPTTQSQLNKKLRRPTLISSPCQTS